MSKFTFPQNPASESCRRLDFEAAEIVQGIAPDTFFLIVKGKTPCINMEVTLSPLIYIICPEYWGIEVIGCLPTGICLDEVGNYDKTIPLTGITGSVGIEVIGATKREKRKVPGGCHAGAEFAKDGPFPMKPLKI